MSRTPPVPPRPRSVRLGWAEIRQRVDQLRAVIEQEWSPTDEEKRRILRARARTLAARRETPPPEGERLEVVEFLLASERYAIEASYLREVCPLRDFTPLPGTPPFVLGLVNVRGELLSVVDLKKFFELPERGLTDLNKVIVVRAGSMELGILADRVVGMKSLSLGEMQAPLPTLTGLRAEYLRGIGKDRLILIDAEKILFDRTIVVQEQAE